jgi:hypothetical protein
LILLRFVYRRRILLRPKKNTQNSAHSSPVLLLIASWRVNGLCAFLTLGEVHNRNSSTGRRAGELTKTVKEEEVPEHPGHGGPQPTVRVLVLEKNASPRDLCVFQGRKKRIAPQDFKVFLSL